MVHLFGSQLAKAEWVFVDVLGVKAALYEAMNLPSDATSSREADDVRTSQCFNGSRNLLFADAIVEPLLDDFAGGLETLVYDTG